MQSYQLFVAKTDPENHQLWLPLWMHALDCAGMMAKLTDEWVSDATITATRLDRKAFREVGILLGMLHDIGKVTSWFQCVITRTLPEMREQLNHAGFCVKNFPKDYLFHGKTPHALAGQWILLSRKIPLSIAAIVGAHHGKPADSSLNGAFSEPGEQLEVYASNFFGDHYSDIWIKTWQAMIADALDMTSFNAIDDLPTLSTQAQVLLSGLLIVADWIASNPYYFPLISCESFGNEEDYPTRIIAGFRKLSFPLPWESPVNYMDLFNFEADFGFTANAIQQTLFDKVNQAAHPGIYVLEAQMGAGKTEAALAAAETLAGRFGEDGIFFGLPTQATSNGIFPRILDWADHVSDDEQSIRLAHGTAALNDDYNSLHFIGEASVDDEDEESHARIHRWFNGNKKALLADFVVGTVDQVLLSVLKRKHFMLRHLGLSGKIVIIDECHAYDAYMDVYLDRAIYWMGVYGVPVILLSATLPAAQRGQFVKTYAKGYAKWQKDLGRKEIKAIRKKTFGLEKDAYPLLTWTDGAIIHQERIVQNAASKKVQILKIKDSDFCDHLFNQLSEGGCAAVIVNTVKKAQELCTRCCEYPDFEGFHIVLYHAQFTGVDRIRKEHELMRRLGKGSNPEERDKTIVIGTQVLEQSLDYDADLMITQWCPMDLLMQRIGRLHRHHRMRPGKLKSAKLFIMQEDESFWDKPSTTIYGDYLLMRTQKLLPDTISLPKDIAPLVQRVYDGQDDLTLADDAYQRAKQKQHKKIKDLEREATSYLMDKPGKNGLIGMLKGDEKSDEKQAEARVRSGGSAVDVLVMVDCGEDDIRFLPGHEDGVVLSASTTPSDDEGKLVARERLLLPYLFNTSIDQTIADLETMNRKRLPAWQQSPWIKGELVLLLDEHLEGSLAGYRISYSFERGLEYEKQGEAS